jgi:hypothetical protein
MLVCCVTSDTDETAVPVDGDEAGGEANVAEKKRKRVRTLANIFILLDS